MSLHRLVPQLALGALTIAAGLAPPVKASAHSEALHQQLAQASSATPAATAERSDPTKEVQPQPQMAPADSPAQASGNAGLGNNETGASTTPAAVLPEVKPGSADTPASTQSSSPAASPPAALPLPVTSPPVSPPEPSPSETATPAQAPKPVLAEPPPEKTGPPSVQSSGQPVGLRLIARPGAYLGAQQKAIRAPFATQASTPIVVLPWPSSGSPLRDPGTGKPGWDVAEVDSDEAAIACEAGHLEKFDPGLLAKAPDGTPVDKDFIAGGLQPCSVASVSWSSLIAYDNRAWPAQAQPARGAKRKPASAPTGPRYPTALKDVFDVVAFPGKRALRKSPTYLLEMSLLADGVAPEDVYRQLAGEEGTARAFARLEALRGHIIWSETPLQSGQNLAERKAVMAMLYSGRAFQHVAVEAKPYGLIWDGQIYRLDAWVIAKGTPQLEKARAFVAFASEPDRMAAAAEQFPYGPARASAVSKVGRHPVLKTEMAPFMPTSPANLRTALQYDARFWTKHDQRLTERFEAWLKGPLPKVEPAAMPPSESPAPASPVPANATPASAPAKSG